VDKGEGPTKRMGKLFTATDRATLRRGKCPDAGAQGGTPLPPEEFQFHSLQGVFLTIRCADRCRHHPVSI